MSGFVAEESIASLDYDFSKFVKGVKGTIKEPSQAAVKEYLGAITDLMPTGKIEDLALVAEEGKDIDSDFKDVIVKVCSGKPSRANLDALPHRVLVAFAGWLYGSLVNPTQTSGMRSSPGVLMNGKSAT